MSHLTRRFAFYGLAAWASITLNFFLPRLMPGDPVSALVARSRGVLHPEALSSLRELLGVTNEPMAAQYVTYLGRVLHGEFGVSITFFPASVGTVIAGGLAWTLLLSGTTLVISFALGSLLGVLAAWRRGQWLDSLVAPGLTLLGAFPYFWLAMLLLFLFGFRLGWFPLRHAYGDIVSPGFTASFALSVVSHAFLPALSIALATLGTWMISMRNTSVGVLAEDYVTLARAKGLSEARIVLSYAARNALLPNITGFGMALGFVLSGSLLTEIVFSYPGQGYLLLQAVRSQDYPLMQGLFLTITFAVLGANFAVEVLTTWLDPRTRPGTKETR